MMELLKRFEEDAVDDKDALLADEDSDEDGDDIAARLESMDLGNCSV